MDHRWFLAVAVVLAACARAYATPTEIRTMAAPDTVFACAREQLGALDYNQNSLDVEALRVNGTKIDLKSRRSDTQFRRLLNKLEVEVSPGADGQTSLTVVPRTFAEYTTQRGPTEVEEKSSQEVRSDAEQLLERCKG
ncbi:MAG TPA: hypothetical protein VFG66_03900 [Gemmatimonadales bacterium]|nr:hypothetical protein [Gemmatimonadales bacterium]